MIENAPPGRRGLSGAIGGAGYAVGIQLASLTALACASFLSPAELQAWGWRIPFWLSLVVALSGLYMRRTLKDLPQPAAAERPSPLAEVFANHLPLVLRIAGLSAFAAIGFQAAFIYIADWLQRVDGASPADTFKVTSVSMLAGHAGVGVLRLAGRPCRPAQPAAGERGARRARARCRSSC